MQPGDIISYLEMCNREGVSLQRGMNFRLGGDMSVILMSVRAGAPYSDRVEDGGGTLIYEGHDVPSSRGGPDPKTMDQPMRSDSGSLTQNGLFYEAAKAHRQNGADPELVRVYEKIKQGIWVYNGIFRLVGATRESEGGRKVFKFRLELTDFADTARPSVEVDLKHERMIPSWVKVAVWKRDKGCCIKCGATDNLHFDHDLPFSKGGTSLLPENVRLLCARHNLQKSNRIE